MLQTTKLCLLLALSGCLFTIDYAFAKKDVTTKPHKIIFSASWLRHAEALQNPIEQVDKIELFHSPNLYFAAPLGKPLLAHLKDAAPEADDDYLLKHGNFRFEFIVNNVSVYTENLNIGAVLPAQKREDIVLSRPLVSQANEDSWGRFLWMRFMHRAGEAAFKPGLNSLSINLSTYIDGIELKNTPIIATGTILIDASKPTASANDIKIQTIAENSGWPVSSASYNEDKIRALNKKIAELDFKDINAIVVVKNGKLLIEQYYNGSARETLHDPRSVGKSFASTILGIAIADGHIKSEEQTLDEFYDVKSFDNYSPTKATVSLKQLLSMSSGFDANDNDSQSAGNENNMYPLDDWVKFALDLPMRSDEENHPTWSYFTAGVVVLGDILHQSVPQGLEKYAHKTLFEPLSINNYQWQFTPTGVANTAGGLALRALDFAKYGQLYKNNGQWQGKQIVPKKWIGKSLSRQVPRGEDPQDGHYGYLFWHDAFPFNNDILEVAYATGNGGNKVYIFKNIDLVVVINASAYNRIYAHPQVNNMMANYILPAVLSN